MDRILRIARKEAAEVLRTKMFWLAMVMPVVFGVLYIVFGGQPARPPRPSAARANQGTRGEQPAASAAEATIMVTDLSGQVLSELQRQPADGLRFVAAPRMRDNGDELPAAIKEGLMRRDPAAYLVIPADVLSASAPCRLYALDMRDVPALSVRLPQAVTRARLRLSGTPSAVIDEAFQPVGLDYNAVAAPAPAASPVARTDMQRLFSAFIFVFLMFMAIISTSQMLVNSVIEEKNSRVVEVLLSSVSPFQLMAGKILGLAAVGLTVSGAAGVILVVTAAIRGVAFGSGPLLAVLFGVYCILGFVLMASFYAAAGSVCSSLKETQTLMFPLILPVMVPMLGWMQIASHPDGAFAVALSLIPLTSPLAMILRLAVMPEFPWAQVTLSLLLLAASVPLTMAAAAKIFRTGILMYGKTPKVREVLRWLRTA